MNSNHEELLFIYELFNKGINVWIEDKNVKVFVPNGVKFTDKQKEFFKSNKDKIFYHLENNKIYSKKDNFPILKSESNQSVLSFAQERLWFIEKYEEGTNIYNIPMVYKLVKNINLKVLENSIKSIISRHEIFRTLIKEDNESKAYQLILDDKKYPFEITKISVTNQIQLNQEIEKSVNHIFDLSTEFSIRVVFYELINNNVSTEYYISIVIHHIAFDGWSHVVLFKELETYYNFYLNQSQGIITSLTLPELPIQYKDFAIWQRDYLTGEKLDKQLGYWKNKLIDYETLNLITDKPRPTQIDYRGNDIYFELDESISMGLRELAKELKVSLYSVLLAGFYLMLRGYSNQNNIVIGTPIANRQYSQIENLIGLFVNSLALRIEIDPNSLIKTFIQKIGVEIVEAQVHQDLPFEKLVEELKLVKDTTRHPIFQIMFGVQSFGGELYNKSSTEVDITNLLEPYKAGFNLHNVAKFDISTLIDDSQAILRGSFNYAVSLYNEHTINGFIETYKEILNQISVLAKDSQKLENTKITNLNYLTLLQYQKIIYSWNQEDQKYPSNRTIHELFEEQVKKTPDNLAVIYEDTKLTYRELNKQANQLANYLKQNHEIDPDTLLVLCLDRGEHMLIAILAVLKAGGAYVPMEPTYPDDRITYILEDTGGKIILTNQLYKKRLEDLSVKANILVIDEVKTLKTIATHSTENIISQTTSTNLAYVIYTSGTTGNPKGVLQLHSNIMRLFTATDKWFEFNNKDVWTLFHSYVFDFSVWEIWGALIYGGKLVIPSYEQTRDPSIFFELCKKEQVTVLNQTPSAFYQFSAHAISKYDVNKLDSLKYVIFGGEVLNSVQLGNWFDCYGYNQPKLINMYGITETTVHVTYRPLELKDLSEYSNIGKLIPDLTAYILDDNLTPLPIGAVGELYIGGAGLARGYLNRPELTAERFIINPFKTREEGNKNTKLYKTGDLARWLPDRSLEYIGRNDFQIKLRGYRIELKEIEAVLSSNELIKQSILIAKNKNSIDDISENKCLIAYYISETKLPEETILRYLQARLPDYMIPSVFVHLEKFPLTINGKLDIKALPDPKFTNIDMYIKPRNELENNLVQIWAEVIGLDKDKIGIKDDFFRSGGNSILAIRLANKINHYYKAHLKVSDIFVYKTIELLLPRLLQTKDSYQTIVKLNNTCLKPNMFMIHPGIGGCEVYTSLADTLANQFSCYGIDSYNLYHDEKINNLCELAKYYLSHIDKVMKETNQDTYHILGWSLGGLISLEIASVLEQRGSKKIKIYILDSVFYDNNLFSILDKDVEVTKDYFRKEAISKGYDQLYIEKSISNIEVEKELVKQHVSSILVNTDLLLFKAMQGEMKFKKDKYNNIGKIFKDISNIKLVQIENAHHGNILQEEEFIFSEIKNYNNIINYEVIDERQKT